MSRSRLHILFFLSLVSSHVVVRLSPAIAQESQPSSTVPTDVADSEDMPVAPTNNRQKIDTIESLRSEYLKIRDRLFQSRARVSVVSSALYSTRLSVQLGYDSARYYTVTRATIRLDGANIYDDNNSEIHSNTSATRFEAYVAPGRHQLSIRIEATGNDDDRFKSIIENSFIVQAEKNRQLTIVANAKDEGDIAYEWSRSKKGSYKLHLDVQIESLPRGAKSNSIPRTSQRRVPK